jgi:hypothetical protein
MICEEGEKVGWEDSRLRVEFLGTIVVAVFEELVALLFQVVGHDGEQSWDFRFCLYTLLL